VTRIFSLHIGPLFGLGSLEVKAAIDDEVEEAQALIEAHIENMRPFQDPRR
jgi:hypothetical protein